MSESERQLNFAFAENILKSLLNQQQITSEVFNKARAYCAKRLCLKNF
jgi:hypothetical protein